MTEKRYVEKCPCGGDIVEQDCWPETDATPTTTTHCMSCGMWWSPTALGGLCGLYATLAKYRSEQLPGV